MRYLLIALLMLTACEDDEPVCAEVTVCAEQAAHEVEACHYGYALAVADYHHDNSHTINAEALGMQAGYDQGLADAEAGVACLAYGPDPR